MNVTRRKGAARDLSQNGLSQNGYGESWNHDGTLRHYLLNSPSKPSEIWNTTPEPHPASLFESRSNETMLHHYLPNPPSKYSETCSNDAMPVTTPRILFGKPSRSWSNDGMSCHYPSNTPRQAS